MSTGSRSAGLQSDRTTTDNSVLYGIEAGVATITLNRPAQLNAITPEMGSRYNEALLRAERSSDVGAIVVTGAGRGFCSGADMAILRSVGAGDLERASAADGIRPELPTELSKPVIAAVNGAAVGVGFAMMVFADVRIVADEAVLMANFARLGLPAEYAMSWVLPRLLGRGRAADLLMTGRGITGVEAGSYGLAERVSPQDEVLATALEIARSVVDNCAPSAVATIKGQLLRDGTGSLQQALDTSASLMREAFAGAAFTAAMDERRLDARAVGRRYNEGAR